jgi:hypothetical protein
LRALVLHVTGQVSSVARDLIRIEMREKLKKDKTISAELINKRKIKLQSTILMADFDVSDWTRCTLILGSFGTATVIADITFGH